MTPEPLIASITQHGPWLVFGNVLLQQLGAPVPVWPTLLVAKFVPGFSAVAAPVAGLSRMPVARFTLAAASGAALWAGAGLLTGWVLRDEVGEALAWMRTHGPLALLGGGAALALWLGTKAWRRHRFRQMVAMPHIDIGALRQALAGDAPPRLLDFRSPALIAADGPIAPAQPMQLRGLARHARGWPRDAAIVTLCACPEDATAIRAAHALRRMGFAHARPLRGGYDAWRAAEAVLQARADALSAQVAAV